MERPPDVHRLALSRLICWKAPQDDMCLLSFLAPGAPLRLNHLAGFGAADAFQHSERTQSVHIRRQDDGSVAREQLEPRLGFQGHPAAGRRGGRAARLSVASDSVPLEAGPTTPHGSGFVIAMAITLLITDFRTEAKSGQRSGGFFSLCAQVAHQEPWDRPIRR
jgi:hypothetical protein